MASAQSIARNCRKVRGSLAVARMSRGEQKTEDRRATSMYRVVSASKGFKEVQIAS